MSDGTSSTGIQLTLTAMFARSTRGHDSMEMKSSGREDELARMAGGQAALTRRVFANSYKEEGSKKSCVW